MARSKDLKAFTVYGDAAFDKLVRDKAEKAGKPVATFLKQIIVDAIGCDHDADSLPSILDRIARLEATVFNTVPNTVTDDDAVPDMVTEVMPNFQDALVMRAVSLARKKLSSNQPMQRTA